MKPTQIPLQEGKFYHIYNRGNNRETLFYTEENYKYFLKKYDKYLSEYIDTYSELAINFSELGSDIEFFSLYAGGRVFRSTNDQCIKMITGEHG